MQVDIDEIYDELLLGGLTSIKVKDANNNEIVISKADIKRLYSGLGLCRAVIKKVIKAHIAVLKHGFATGNERVIVIDNKTGNTVADESGTATRVAWRMSSAYKGSIAVIHNHPNSTVFSPTDLYSFGSVEQIKSISVQGHDGRIYVLRKTANTQFAYTEDILKGVLRSIRQKHKDKSYDEQGEIFVKYIAGKMKWEYLKGGE